MRGNMRHIAGDCLRPFLSFSVLTAAVLLSSPLSALELNQAIESCRASSGKPSYIACKQAGGTHEACFGRARAIVQSCVRSAMIAAHPKAALFSAEKLSQPRSTAGKPGSAESAGGASPGMVAPPRTISDITAILDQQKPDPAEIAKLTAAAEVAVPTERKGAELADFYYQRAQARVLLGRIDSLDDAALAVSHATGAD